MTPQNTSFPSCSLLMDGGRRVLLYGLECKLDTTVNGVRKCVRLYVSPLVKTNQLEHETVAPSLRRCVFWGFAELFFPSLCSRSASLNTHPRHHRGLACIVCAFREIFPEIRPRGQAGHRVACALTEPLSGSATDTNVPRDFPQLYAQRSEVQRPGLPD